MLLDPSARRSVCQLCSGICKCSGSALDRTTKNRARADFGQRVLHGIVVAQALFDEASQRRGHHTAHCAFNGTNSRARAETAKRSRACRCAGDDRGLAGSANDRDEVQEAHRRISESASDAADEVRDAGRAGDHVFAFLPVAAQGDEHFRLSVG